jgi:hypothetical protein
VSALTFTINDHAILNAVLLRRRSTRGVLRAKQTDGAVQHFLSPEQEYRASGYAQFDAASSTHEDGGGGELLARLPSPANAIARVKHSKYKRFLISTTLRTNGTWVASYGKTPTTLLPAMTREPAIAESEVYLAESLALADARLDIDGGRKKPWSNNRQVQSHAIIRRIPSRASTQDE